MSVRDATLQNHRNAGKASGLREASADLVKVIQHLPPEYGRILIRLAVAWELRAGEIEP